MCPQVQNKCGTDQAFAFEKEDEMSSIDISGLQSGDTCTYRVNTKCGGPGFRLHPDSTATDSQINVSYFEVDNKNYGRVGTSSMDTSLFDRQYRAPHLLQPRRNQDVMYSGIQDFYGGQFQPQRMIRGNGNLEPLTPIGKQQKAVNL